MVCLPGEVEANPTGQVTRVSNAKEFNERTLIVLCVYLQIGSVSKLQILRAGTTKMLIDQSTSGPVTTLPVSVTHYLLMDTVCACLGTGISCDVSGMYVLFARQGPRRDKVR